MRRIAKLVVVAVGALAVQSASAAEPVRRIEIYVQPYYVASQKPGQPPQHVAVGRTYDGLLASMKKEDILAARDRVEADPRTTTPMTMMVLAIRLYDVGLRDDALFWFYAAKDRYLTLVDVATGGLAQVEQAVRDFATLAGPFINGYAFCDVANQQAIRAKALDWVEKNPYEAMFMEPLPAKSSNRRQALVKAHALIRDNAAKERAYLQDPANVAKLRADRAANGADDKYCWK